MLYIILSITIFQTLFFSALILTKKRKSAYDIYTLAWFVGLSIHMLSMFLSVSIDGFWNDFFNYLRIILTTIHGTFLFLSTKSVFSPQKKVSYKDLLNFSPLVILLAIGAFTCFKITPLTSIISLMFYGIYILISIWELQKFKNKFSDYFSNAETLNIKWHRPRLYGQIFFYIIVSLHEANYWVFNPNPDYIIVFAWIMFAFVSFFGFIGIKKAPVLSNNSQFIDFERAQVEQVIPTETKNNPYVNYGLKHEEALVLADKIKQCMDSDRPYLNPELNLKELADLVKTYPHYITQVLNTIFSQNFYDFINSYRVEEAKKQLTNYRNSQFTILAIALDCGFSSKATFNRVFKLKTGFTPTEFCKSVDK